MRGAFCRTFPVFLAAVAWGGAPWAPLLAAQGPGVPGKALAEKALAGKAAEPPLAKQESVSQTKERLAKSLADTRKQLAAMDANGPGTVPEGVTPAEVADRRADLVRAVYSIERHLKGLDNAAVMGDAAKEAQRREQEWKSFEQPPPFSFVFFDELRVQRDAARAKLEAFQSTLTLIERQVGASQQEFRQAEEENRRAADVLARSKGGAGEAAAAWRLESAAINLRAAGAMLAFYQSSVTNQQPRIAAAKSELTLLDRQLAAIGEAVVFRDEDITKLEETARSKVAAVNKELAILAKRQSTVLAERDRVRGEVEALRQKLADDATKPREPVDQAEGRLRGAEVEAEALSFQIDLLGASTRLQTEMPTALQLRRKLSDKASADERMTARKELESLAERAHAWATFIANERTAVGAAVREQESRLAAMPEEDPSRPVEDRVLAAQWRKIEVVDRLDQVITGHLRTLDRWLADGDKLMSERSFGARAADLGAKIWNEAGKIWRTEVYRYEDKMEVNGETITSERGLTLGWLLGALTFFLVAYRVSSWLSRRVQKVMVRHGWAGEAQARTLGRWWMVLVGMLLALVTLQLLKIPVTAFAFLGGALAIGVGFGTQTLFKNFISGIIVLVERKVKVGDILDVDGTVGTVTVVDTRSSTIRGFDGVETLVPNSVLLDNKVTNWTHSNARVRRVLRVGVAYGSPVQRVAEILADCADRHGLVLENPAPVVLFEDFGSDSLVFALFFWVELDEHTNPSLVASDLRFMLDKRFAEAGIMFAFPQRDLHLASAVPLKVEVVQEA